MHQMILLKIRADTRDEALNLAKSRLEDTCGEGKAFTFDYMSEDNTFVVTPAKLKMEGFKSFAALEKDYKDSTVANMTHAREQIREMLAKAGAARWLSAEEAPSLMGNNEMTPLVESALKNDKGRLPTSFDDLVTQAADVVADMCCTPLPMVTYYLGKIEEVWKARAGKYLLENDCLHSTDVHFCDMSHGENLGEKIFYVIGDRHH